MPTFSKILGAIDMLLEPSEVKKSLNPAHLALGARGYEIQSRLLRIPDRYGFFSPGPPRLQVHEGCLFFINFLLICYLSIASAVIVWVMSRLHVPWISFFVVVSVVVQFMLIFFTWAVHCADRNDYRDCEWGGVKQSKQME
ncbi:hypothetical protein F4818DRAFT_436655 [Hypoxylon cercidicola]|nr:hypothetical protein F4818DRAFT_436655 [Hypoxylon cercidicola]